MPTQKELHGELTDWKPKMCEACPEMINHNEAKIWIHGFPAKSWEQVIEYLKGDAHDRSKIQILINGQFYSIGLKK